MTTLSDHLTTLRRDFHKYPELGFKEVRTSKVIEEYLQNLGIETKKIATTGIIGTLKGKLPGKVIALRADMDALPIQEISNCSYKSLNDGSMHACGHDAHIAILLGVAKYFSTRTNTLKGTIRFIFQPGEEMEGGAFDMIDKGCLDAPKVDAIFGLHVWSKYPLGSFCTLPGPIMASTGEVKIEIIGKAGHGAMPHETIDPIVVAAQYITAVQSIISRNLNPLDAGVITFGTIKGGSKQNVIDACVELTGTIRAMKDENLAYIKARLEEVLKGICAANGAQYKIDLSNGYASLVNDQVVTKKVMLIADDMFDKSQILQKQTMGGEDFAYYLKKVPGCYFFIGAGNDKKGILYPQHHPSFDIDEDVLPIGVEMFVRICENFLP
ncbi:MAG: amidohydrolase [Bacteriovoracaceae bacterium]|nr:amidohydrolase [Bacteriovoracaceae bacterium]